MDTLIDEAGILSGYTALKDEQKWLYKDFWTVGMFLLYYQLILAKRLALLACHMPLICIMGDH